MCNKPFYSSGNDDYVLVHFKIEARKKYFYCHIFSATVRQKLVIAFTLSAAWGEIIVKKKKRKKKKLHPAKGSEL